jgi:hypothetical protein
MWSPFGRPALDRAHLARLGRDHGDRDAEVPYAVRQVVMQPAGVVLARGREDDLVEALLLDEAADRGRSVFAGLDVLDGNAAGLLDQAGGVVRAPVGRVRALLRRDQQREGRAGARPSLDLLEQLRWGNLRCRRGRARRTAPASRRR